MLYKTLLLNTGEMMKKPIAPDLLFFSIKEASKQVGVVPATIRNWEKRGLFQPRRQENGYRVLTMDDINRLKKLKEGIPSDNLNTRDRLLDGFDESVFHSDSLIDNRSASKQLLGEKWKQSRLEKGESLEDVARQVGISTSYLSKIENAQANNISFEILQKLASFYGDNILYYIHNNPEEGSNFVAMDEADIIDIGIPGLVMRDLVKLPDNTLSVLYYSIQPECCKQKSSSHNGEEFVFVTHGTLEITLDDKVYMLNEGDSICFSSRQRHNWRNPGLIEANCIWVYTPFTNSGKH